MYAPAAAILAAPVAEQSTEQLVWTAAVVAWVAAVPLYFVTKFVDVIAHEGGHALVAKLLFQRLDSIRFQTDGSGGTGVAGGAPWLVNIFIGLAGYLGPSLFGLLAAKLLLEGAAEAVLWGSLGFLFLMLFAVRGLLGWLLVPGMMALIAYIAVAVDQQPQRLLLTYIWVWFLLIVPVESMLSFMRDKIYNNPGSDSAKLRDLTFLPSAFWGVIFLAGTIAALIYGGAMLLRIEL